MDFENKVLHGDCLVRLRQIPSDTFDAAVFDPPYGLGSEPTPEEIIAYLQGADLVTGDFMGKDWDIPSVPVWREIFRVLKPGAHVTFFGGTRTFELLAMGARMVGFERRDTIPDNFPGVQWLQSQGMPKSTNISKAIGKRAEKTQDEAIAEEVSKWLGRGTALKPCWEPILLLRKPLEQKTLVGQVLTTGTGVLNIDGCRVKHASPADLEKHKAGVEAIKARGGSMSNSWKNSSDLSGANDVTSAGRWPPNVLMTHAEGCQLTEDGWSCTTECPVGLLDEQSGDRPATLTGRADPTVSHDNPGDNHGASWFGGGNSRVYADEGGASKYFPQFDPFLYNPKASRKDREGWVPDGAWPFQLREDLREHECTQTVPNTFVACGEGDNYCSETCRLVAQLGLGTKHKFLDEPPVGYEHFFEQPEDINTHPTVKPIALMRWLIRLVAPQKGGLVLDPYCGSGSTLQAAVEEGMRYTGIDRWDYAFEVATLRMRHVRSRNAETQHQQRLLDLIRSSDVD